MKPEEPTTLPLGEPITVSQHLPADLASIPLSQLHAELEIWTQASWKATRLRDYQLAWGNAERLRAEIQRRIEKGKAE